MAAPVTLSRWEPGSQPGIDSSLSGVLGAPAGVYLPVTDIPGGMVHFTRARKTTACRGATGSRFPSIAGSLVRPLPVATTAVKLPGLPPLG